MSINREFLDNLYRNKSQAELESNNLDKQQAFESKECGCSDSKVRHSALIESSIRRVDFIDGMINDYLKTHST